MAFPTAGRNTRDSFGSNQNEKSIGALHALHMHWTVTEATATIVMPTGTGKTETMLSILTSVRCPRLLVVVPTDALRSQIAGKFVTLGLLKKAGVGAGYNRLLPLSAMICCHREDPILAGGWLADTVGVGPRMVLTKG